MTHIGFPRRVPMYQAASTVWAPHRCPHCNRPQPTSPQLLCQTCADVVKTLGLPLPLIKDKE